MASSDLTQELIDYGSQLMELEYTDILGQQFILQKQMDSHSLIQNQSPQAWLQTNQFEQEFLSQANCSTEQTNYQTPALALNKRKPIHRSQSIRSQIPISRSDDSEDQTPGRRYRRNRKRRGKKEGYPTKNFLPNFKGPHIQYLQKKLTAQFVNSFEIVQTIISKNGVSMKDYQILYNTKEFQETFTQFFREKVLYRQLMLSRSSMKARKVHLKKLSVFQKAFAQKSFQRIN